MNTHGPDRDDEESAEDKRIVSAAIGYATGSTILGALLGGDILGAAVGDALEGDGIED